MNKLSVTGFAMMMAVAGSFATAQANTPAGMNNTVPVVSHQAGHANVKIASSNRLAGGMHSSHAAQYNNWDQTQTPEAWAAKFGG